MKRGLRQEDCTPTKRCADKVSMNIRKAIEAAQGQCGTLEGVELELRIGRYRETKFEPGVREGTFELIRRRLSSDDRFEARPELAELVYIPDCQGMRYVCDPRSERLVRVNQKERIARFHDDETRMMYDEFDIRFSLAIDRDVPAEELQRYQERCGGIDARFDVKQFLRYENSPYERRLKRRISFTDRGRMLRIDLTKVESHSCNTAGTTDRAGNTTTTILSHEVEIELTPQALENPSRIDIGLIYNMINLFMLATNVARDPHWFDDVTRDLCDVNAGDARAAIDIVRRVFPRADTRFPGSMPINFRARHINEVIKRGDYFVSEKTDGERYFLCVRCGGGAYLVNRKMSVFVLKSDLGRYLSSVFAQRGDTLLDIELVRHLNTLRPVFMVFDVMLSNGDSRVKDMNLNDRLREIGRLIKIHRKAPGYRTIPIDVIGKAFLPVRHISVFRELITQIGGMDQHGSEPRRVYNDRTRRCHFSDGLIFAPNAPYVQGTDMNLIKWKYPAYCTIDFQFRAPRDDKGGRWAEVSLLTHTKVEGKLVTVVFGKGCVDRCLIPRQACDMDLIGEFYYDRARNNWFLCGIRSNEKTTPNSNIVAADILASLAEDVSLDELEYRLLSDDDGSVWRRTLAEAKSNAIKQLLDSIKK